MSLYKMVELGTLIQQAKTVRCGSDDYPILSMTMHDGLVFQDDKFKKIIASKDRSDYKVVKRNQLVISFPIDEGVLAAQRIVDAGIVSPAYSIWDIDQEKILPEFLEYALRCDRALSYYKAKLRGSTARRRSLPTPTLLAFTVPLPSVSEQQFVLDVIHEAKKIIDNRSEEIQQLDNLVKARFVEMFGTETEFDKWPCCTIGDVADVCVGVVIKPTQYYTDKGIPAFRSLNIGEMRVKDSDWVYFTEEGHQKNQKSVVHKNDVLVVRSGAPGTACVATEKYDGYNAVDIIIAHPDNNKVNSIFLAAFTNMPHGMNQICERTGGAAQQHFNVGGYKAMRLIMPSIELQNRFATFVEQTDKSKVVESIHRMNVLFNITLNGGNRYDIRANEF